MGQGRAVTAGHLAVPLGAALVGLVLGGCSGTPFGDRLAGSFSAPPTAAPASSPSASAPAASGTAPAVGTRPPATRPAGGDASPAPQTPTGLTKTPQKPSAAVALAPAPYRITIKLPSGDPSAPAEVVTQALRAAGVAFEVEMIERVSPTAPVAAPAPQPAPAPRPR
jgi:hypothetical protein